MSKNSQMLYSQDVHEVLEGMSKLIFNLQSRIGSIEALLVERFQHTEYTQTCDRWYYSAIYEPFTPNLYSLEFHENLFWRWVGPIPSLDFTTFLTPGRSYRIIIEVAHFFNDAARQNFKISVNENALNICLIPNDPRYRSIDVYSTEFFCSTAECRINISTKFVDNAPEEISNDPRKLSFAIRSISVE